jgi:hypothetical protein
MKLLEVEEQQADRPRRPRGGNKDSIYKAVFFMNTFAVCAVVQSSIFKSVHKNYGFEVLDYFILRNVALSIVALTLAFFWKVDL